MRVLCEASWIKEGTEDDEEPVTEKGQYWMLHFGLKHEIIHAGDGKIAVTNWTVCICENYDTGQIECFDPEQIRILGTQIKK